MSRGPMCRVGTVIRVLAGTALFLGCQDAAESPAGPELVSLAGGGGGKPASGPSVTSASPAFGNAGEVGKRVTIRGSGFTPGAQAAWERGGGPDPKVTVISTEFVSSTELVATITIAPDASIDLYDISVALLDRKKGIGYALFEVTQAIAISGTEIALGANSSGEFTGRVGVPGAFYFSVLSGLETLGAPGRGHDISADGLTVVGGNTINAPNSEAYVFTRSGGVWTKTALPKDPASCIATARTVASDPFTGAATMIGGVENGGCYSGKNLKRQPRVWVLTGGSWIKNILPAGAGTDNLVDDITAAGVAVGMASNQAAVWDPDGLGGWTLTTLGAQGGYLHGITPNGNLAVGTTGNAAVYWTRSGVTWSGPFGLPASCSSAAGVDGAGRILVNDCPNGNRRSPAVILPPYGTGDVVFLGGLGDSRNASTGQSISTDGGWIAGQASLKGTGVGVYWRIF